MTFPDFASPSSPPPPLEHAYQQLRQTLLQSPALIATLAGPDHRFTFTNPGYDQLVNHRARLGGSVAECLPEATELGFGARLDEVYRTGTPWHDPEMRLPKGGAEGVAADLYLNITYQPLRDPSGTITGILAFIIDVTGQVEVRRRAEALHTAVQAADVRLRRLTEALPIITFTISPAGDLSYVSPQWYAYTGQTPGGPWAEVDATWRQQLHPDDLEPVVGEIQASLAEARPMRAELRVRGADGRYRWFQSEIVSAWDADGQLLLHHGYLLDVHELRATQLELQLRDQQLSQILRQLPAGIATLLGPEHRFGYFTPGYNELIGNRAELGRTVAEALPELVEQGLVGILDHVYHTGQTHLAEETRMRVPGPAPRERVLSMTYQGLRDIGGRIVGVLVFVLDVTPATLARQRLDALQAEALAAAELLSRQAQVRAQELHQMKADFVTLASHEFRTPLNTILTATSLLEHYFTTADAPNHHKHVQRVKAAIHDLTSILTGFVHLNTLSTEPTPALRTAVDLPAFIEDAVDQLSAGLLPGQRLDLQASGPAGTVMLDGNLLKHILVNLVSNASKYSPEHATIYLTTEVDDAALRVTVRDEGIGIPEEDQEYLFNDFFRARNATHIQGTGLGLYMVRRYVELMRGQLAFRSTLGQGSQFSVRLPLHAPTL